jgi:hypothetical protein
MSQSQRLGSPMAGLGTGDYWDTCRVESMTGASHGRSVQASFMLSRLRLVTGGPQPSIGRGK